MEAPTTPEEAARELFREHGSAVYRFAAVLLRQHQDAEDVLQETFLKLLRHLAGGGRTDNIRGWLFTVAAHAARDRQRRRARWIPWTFEHDLAVPPARLLDEDGRLTVVRQTLLRLSERDRLLLVLWAQQLTYREIASATGIRLSSVGTLLARAMDRWEQACAAIEAPKGVKSERHGLL
jgi:RNA polymerase sigma-70 factor, ECF subfamily